MIILFILSLNQLFFSAFQSLIKSCQGQKILIACLVGYNVSANETHIVGAVKIDDPKSTLDTWQKFEEFLPSSNLP